ncbi:MAG: amidohydrolase family protein [Ignavibacteriaceae bacterium]
MLIDCHTHAFADKIADKARNYIIEYYGLKTNFGARFCDLMDYALEASLDALVLLTAATKPEQVHTINNWILKTLPALKKNIEKSSLLVPEVIPFGAYHTGDSGWLQEIARLRTAKIKGIKLHPEFQGIDLADPALNDFFAEIENDFIVMIHVGDRTVSDKNLSTPKKVAAIHKNFPRLKIIAAHMGGYKLWDEAYEFLAGKDLYIDTSSAICYMEAAMIKKIIKRHGTDKVLFGSDFPMKSPKEEYEVLDRLHWLTTPEKEKIAGINCSKLLEIKT